MNHYNGNIQGKTFAVWGLSFKPKTDDMREAPSVVIIEKLLAQGAKVLAHDPVAMNEAKHSLGDKITYCAKQEDALNNADALLIVTEWPEFRSPDFEEVKNKLTEAVIFDGRNIYDAEELKSMGFKYYGIGVK